MSRNDKIGAFVLGGLLFAGLFYFIYTTMRNPLPSDLGNEDFAADNALDNQDLPDEDTVAPDEEAPAVSTAPATAPAAPAK